VSDLSYTFKLRPARREAAFFYAVFVAYPSLVGRFLFYRRPTTETILYLLFSPLLILRNLFTGILSTFPFCLDIDYQLTLHDGYLSFGPDIERAQMANSYSNIEGTFKVGSSWIALLHDGYIVYLPPGDGGQIAAQSIRSKSMAQSIGPASGCQPIRSETNR